jgi:hypothetical protein
MYILKTAKSDLLRAWAALAPAGSHQLFLARLLDHLILIGGHQH